MVYCSICGKEITDGVYFCPKCGNRTEQGKAANVSYPHDEVRDIMDRVGIEFEKAFAIAAKETQSAFEKVKENMQQKNKNPSREKQKEIIVCSNCGHENVSDAKFCYECGERIKSEDTCNGT